MYLHIFLISSGVQICWYAGKEADKPLKSGLQEFNMFVVQQLKTCFIQNTESLDYRVFIKKKS